jgi:predicted Zn-dependent protease
MRFALFLTAASLAAAPSWAASAPQPVPLSGASYQFALAKLLAVEGSLPEALAAYQEAERLAPDAPYVRLEHAQLLARMSEYSRNPKQREDYLRQAAERVDAARRLAPENLDVLRGVGSIYLDLAAQDPAALGTARDVLEAVRRRDPADVQSLITLGRIYLDQEQPAKAAEVFRDLVANVPQQRMAYSLLVESLLRAEKPAEAEAALVDILAIDPGSLEARLTLAELQDKRGDQDAVVTNLKSAPEDLRKDARLRRQLAVALYQTGELDESLALVEPLLAAAPDDRGLSLLKGWVLTAQGRNAEATEVLGGLRAKQPGDATVAITLARVLQREGRRGEAARLLGETAEALEKDGKAAEARELRLEQAQAFFDAKEWSQVAQALDPLLAAEDPAVREQALLLRADALIESQQWDDATALLGRQEKSALVDSRRAEVLLRSGREAEGLEVLGAMSASNDPQQVLAAVQVYHRLDRFQESIPILEQMKAAHPELPVPAFLLGAAYERSQQRDKALAALRRVVELQPNFHAALNYLGYTYAEAGENLDEAVKLIRRALTFDPDNGAYVDSLGWAYFQLGRHDEARTYLERAARLEPEDATLQEHLGDVYVALGQTDRARLAYQRALELDDEEEVGEQVRRKLEDLKDKPKS